MDRIERAAREVFGFERLRPGQHEAVAAVLDGRDTLAVMSTGYGKSAIYQIAALLIPGPTVVVSPLLALQRDQIEELDDTVASGGAAGVNSLASEGERREALEDLEDDELEFLFVSPEQLANEEVLAEVAAAGPSLLVVDEAHCISEWGHDFRPDYLRLAAAAEALGRPTILALTATAAPPVRDEIVERLGMRDPEIVVRGFDRPNLYFAVEPFHGENADARKQRALVDRIAAAPVPGIVYVATRRQSEELAEALRDRDVRAASYHAGMRGSERDRVQERFMDGGLDVVCATTAFGMGIDKADVRWVFHSEISESLDAYYQEIGRAGRDGEPAEAVLFYRSEDLGVRPRGEVAEGDGAPAPKEAIAAAAEAEEKRRSFERSRVDMMRGYAETDECRRAFVLSYFGEPFTPPCGNCDNCDAGKVSAPPADVPFPVGARVTHGQWGEGVVQRYDDDAMVVLFDEAGYKTLALEVVRARPLLRAA